MDDDTPQSVTREQTTPDKQAPAPAPREPRQETARCRALVAYEELRRRGPS
ncbi:hypothetical protein [Nonomuraea recticatena]|uniref:Uncharacterized protein n=1 Tax=Nonomuraea recticatena TaxID=46178 RepID=A0ABN3S8K8_9ACTN